MSPEEKEQFDKDMALQDKIINELDKQRAIEDGKYIYNFKELLALELNVDNLLEPIIPSVGLAWLAGMPDSGKSTFARELAIRCVLGYDEFMGFELKPKHRRALCVLTEETLGRARDSMSKQFFALFEQKFEERRQAKKQDPAIALPEWGAADALNNLDILPAHSLTGKEVIELIQDKLAKQPYDIVILDALADVVGKIDPNNAFQVREALRPYNSICEEYECLLFLIGHIKKDEYNKTPSQAALAGSGAFAQKARLVLDLRPDLKQEGVKYFTVVKGNTVDDSFKRDSFVLHWDKSTHLLTYQGERVPCDSLASTGTGGPPKTFIEWESFIRQGEVITFPELWGRMKGRTPLSMRTLRDRVKQELRPMPEQKWALHDEQGSLDLAASVTPYGMD